MPPRAVPRSLRDRSIRRVPSDGFRFAAPLAGMRDALTRTGF